MPKPVEYRITNLTEFTQQVENALLSTRTRYSTDPAVVNWYRGTGMAETWKLSPGLYRHEKIKDISDLLKLERRLLADFKREAILYQPTNLSLTHSSGSTDTDYEFLFFMQHHGVPTRLLDWTGNPFIALYFALTSAPYDIKIGGYTENAAVWILDPIAWNNKSLSDVSWGDKGALSFNDTEFKGYAPRKSEQPTELVQMYPNPAAIHGIANNTRMFAQKGVFTIFGRNTNPMEQIYEDEAYPSDSLIKLTVDKSDIDRVMKLVISIGYTDSVSYPDLHGLAMEIRRFHNFKV